MHILHHTCNTEHVRKSYLHEVGQDIIELVQGYVRDMQQGIDFEVSTGYACRLADESDGFALFEVYKFDESLTKTPIARFAIALENSPEVWRFLKSEDADLETPFLSARILDNLTHVDVEFIHLLADFERCVAWTWIKEKNK